MITILLPNLILFSMVAAAVVVVVVVVSATRHPHPAPPAPPFPPQRMSTPALSELDLRYARGEIEREEYLRRRSDILEQ